MSQFWSFKILQILLTLEAKHQKMQKNVAIFAKKISG